MQSKWPLCWRLVGIAGWLMLAGNSGLAVQLEWEVRHAPLWPGAADIGWRVAPLPGGDLVAFGETTDDRHGSDLIVFRLAAATGERLWERRIDDPYSGTNTAYALAVDASGHIAIAGTTSDDRDMYTARLSPADGSILWEKTYSGPGGGYDQPLAVATFANGDIVVSGYTRNVGSFDTLTIRYAAADGAVLWQRSFNGAENLEDVAEAVAVDAAGDVLVAGYAGWANSSKNADYYVGKLDGLTGSPIWEVVHAGGGNDIARAIALDAAGNPVVTGLSSNGVNDDILTVKFAAADGAVLWERRYNGPANGADGPRGVAVGAGGDVFVAGSSENATDYDRYLARYAGSDGSLVWEYRYNGQVGGNNYGRAMVLDLEGNPVVTGASFNGTDLDFETSKHDATTGSPIWAASYGGSANGEDVSFFLTMDVSGNVAVIGRSHNGTDFDFTTVAYNGTDGAQRWVNRYNGPTSYDEERGDIAVDSFGNVIITGSSYNGRNDDLVTIKQHATTGEVLWEVRYNGPDDRNEAPGKVAVDSLGDVFVACGSSNADNEDIYLAKYRGSTGALVWQKRFDGTLHPDSSDWPVAIAVDKWGDLVVLSRSDGDFHLAIYASIDGMLLFETRYDSGINYPEALALDYTSGNMAVTGTVRLPSSWGTDIVTLFYSGQDGSLLWQRRYEGPNDSTDGAIDLAIDSQGNVVVTGRGEGLEDFQDIYTAKYAAADGAVLWENLWNGGAESQDRPNCLAIDAQDNIIIGGLLVKYLGIGPYGNQLYDYQIYLAKYASADGSLMWENRELYGGDFYGVADLAVDSGDNIVLVYEREYNLTDNLYKIQIARHNGQDGAVEWYATVSDVFNYDHLTKPLLELTPDQHVALLSNVQELRVLSQIPELETVLGQPDLFSALVIEYPPPSISLNANSVTVEAGDEAVITGTFSYAGTFYYAGGYLEKLRIWASVGNVTKDDATGVWTWKYTPTSISESGTVTVKIGDGEHSPMTAEFQLVVKAVNTAPVPVTSAKLHAVGDLPGGINLSEVRDATKVGNEVRAVGGTSTREGSNRLDTAFLWSSTAGISALPDLVENPTATSTVVASAITRDGAFIASRARNSASGQGRSAVRVAVAGLDLLDLRQEPFTGVSAANAISSDGSVLYGFGQNTSTGRSEAFRYNASDGSIEAIPPLLPEDDETGTSGRACSDDGSVMIGTSSDLDTEGFDYYGPGNRAFRYKHGQGVTAIPLLPGGSWSMGLAVSPNDVLALVIGDSPAAPNGEIYLYNADLGTVRALGTPNAAWRGGNLAGMTANGSVIVVNFGTEDGSAGGSFVRTSAGWRDLHSICTQAGINLTGWNLDTALGISPDGTLVWGGGWLDGQRTGWVIEFPPDYLENLPGLALHSVGDLSGGAVHSEVRDATRVDGVIMAVGGSSRVAGSVGSDTAILWTSTEGMIAIPNAVENPNATNPVLASAITPDGRYIATRTRMSPTGGLRQAARVETDTLLPLPLAQPVEYVGSSAANSISDDGSVLYGFGNNNTLAARYHADGSPGIAIPRVDPDLHTSNYPAGRAISADGSVMAGYSGSSGSPGPGYRGFRYTQGFGVTAIPLLPGGTWNTAFALTPDGKTVVAAGDAPGYPNGAVYLYESESESLTELDSPNGSAGINIVGGITADQSVVAGALVSDYFHNAYGWHSLKDVLRRNGIPLENWGWLGISGISRDGRLVFGQGLHNFASEGYVAEFPAGFLAGYEEPAIASHPHPAITGAWSGGETGSNQTLVCLLPSGWFLLYGLALPGEEPFAAHGMERGHFDWNAVTREINATTLFDQNGDIGLSGLPFGPAVSITVSGDTFTAASEGEAPNTFTRVRGSSPLVGCWIRDGSDVAAGRYTVLAFLPDGSYFHMQEGPVADGGRSGGEHGTYSWDEVGGLLTVTTLTDRNGAWGFNSGISSAVVLGDKLNGEFTRIKAAPILFNDWRELHFTEAALAEPAISGPAADFNMDGFPNLFHYALGLAPDADASANLLPPTPQFLPELDSTFLIMALTMPVAQPPDITYLIQESRDLQSWTTLDTAAHTLTLEANDNSTLLWTIRSDAQVPSNPDDPPLFLRIGVAPSPP